MKFNYPELLIDGYKLDHRRQYPPGTEYIYSNWTPRSSRVPGQHDVVFFGLQYFLSEYLMDLWGDNFFDASIKEIMKDYEEFTSAYLGPNEIGSKHLAELHELGYLPLEFRALPEGTLTPIGVPMLTVTNTDPRFFWLVNYVETIMSNILWKPCTSATSAYRVRKVLEKYAKETGAPLDFVKFQGHDFSFRGMSGLEDAMLSGAAHLTSFVGTDTIPAIKFVEEFYPNSEKVLIGCSVPATEHSVMSAGGDMNEKETIERLLRLYPQGFVSVVSDTWNLWKVLVDILPNVKREILDRNGKYVTRPDSGDPTKIVCGNVDATDPNERAGVADLLWKTFPGKTNSKGYKNLDPHVGMIYGDAITEDRATSILEGLKRKGYASDNIVFGVGSFTYQLVTRDTYGFAMKATWAQINGEGRALYKNPVTDNGEKKSAVGRLAVLHGDFDNLVRVDNATEDQERHSLLQPVWKNGEFVNGLTSLSEIRERLYGKNF